MTVSAVLAALGVLVFSSFRLEAVTLEQQRLEAATQTIALAVSDVSRGFRTGFPCDVARVLAELNEVRMMRCRLVGFDAFIETSSLNAKPALTSRARAGG